MTRRFFTAEQFWQEYERQVAEVDQFERDMLHWNAMHPEDPINSDVSLERARLEKLRQTLPARDAR